MLQLVKKEEEEEENKFKITTVELKKKLSFSKILRIRQDDEVNFNFN